MIGYLKKRKKDMNIIEEYEAGLINFEEFEKYIWGCGQRLINEVGIDKFIFYLNAKEGEYYDKE
ncbi:hypothetical protein RV18_GL001837 [Enterococcus termitis]|nr:hypothetical protein RV18_GL001837 [Enterococcus termitis]